jgi:hypothetical protein
VTAYTDANFAGSARRFDPNEKQPSLDAALSGRIESLEIACREPDRH